MRSSSARSRPRARANSDSTKGSSSASSASSAGQGRRRARGGDGAGLAGLAPGAPAAHRRGPDNYLPQLEQQIAALRRSTAIASSDRGFRRRGSPRCSRHRRLAYPSATSRSASHSPRLGPRESQSSAATPGREHDRRRHRQLALRFADSAMLAVAIVYLLSNPGAPPGGPGARSSTVTPGRMSRVGSATRTNVRSTGIMRFSTWRLSKQLDVAARIPIPIPCSSRRCSCSRCPRRLRDRRPGEKYLQTRAFADERSIVRTSIAARDIDPRWRKPKLKLQRGRVVSEFMCRCRSQAFLRLLGMRGLCVVPALSAIVAFCAQPRRLGRRAADPRGSRPRGSSRSRPSASTGSSLGARARAACVLVRRRFSSR